MTGRACVDAPPIEVRPWIPAYCEEDRIRYCKYAPFQAAALKVYKGETSLDSLCAWGFSPGGAAWCMNYLYGGEWGGPAR